MSNDKDLAQLKKEAVMKAKEATLAKLQAKKEAATQEEPPRTSEPTNETEEEKIKRLKKEAVAKAKEATLAKLQAKKEAATQEEPPRTSKPTNETEEEKIKRLKKEAVAKAKETAQEKQQQTNSPTTTTEPASKNDQTLAKYIKVTEDHVGKLRSPTSRTGSKRLKLKVSI